MRQARPVESGPPKGSKLPVVTTRLAAEPEFYNRYRQLVAMLHL